MNILYLGHFFPPNLLETVSEDSGDKIGFSNHNFERSLVNGFSQQKNINLRVITVPGVFSYPYNNKRFFTRSEKFSFNDVDACSVGFCNLPIIKEIAGTWTCAVRILKVVSQYPPGDINVVVNTLSKRLLDAVKYAKLLSKRKFTLTVIVPDIPAMVTAMDKSNRLKSWFLRKRNDAVMKYARNCEGLVVLTEAMMEWFDKNQRHIVMEGIVGVGTMTGYNDTESANEVILYTGTLRYIFGIMNLVKAFIQIPDRDVELWICGSGEAAFDIQEIAKKDSRIKFLGLVSSVEALKIQRQATILVNPRTSVGEYTKYSFPSKTMEYLLAGKSVIVNRLPGIPDEYFNYVFTPSDESVNSLSKCILEVLNTNKKTRIDKALAGKNFIISKKNSVRQVGRIIEMIDEYARK